MGVENGISSRYLCKHRTPCYSQENRSPSPYLCTYMGRTDSRRGKAFRFILNDFTAVFTYLNHIYRRGTAVLCPYSVVYLPENNCNAITTNVYLMLYPKPILVEALLYQPSLKRDLWLNLNDISDEAVTGGIGLDYLKQFVHINKGKLQILSHDGCATIDEKQEIYVRTQTFFGGTLVNITLLCDESRYELDFEADDEPLF
jgi:hypothetical protein